MRKSLIYSFILLVLLNTACSTDNANNSILEPGILNLATPADASTCVGTSTTSTKCEVVLNWNPTADSDSYTIKITNLNTNKVVLIQNSLIETSFKVVLEKKVPYSWSIVSRDLLTDDVTNQSPVWKFYASAGESVANYVPFPADMIAPIQDKIVTAVDGKVTLKWAGSDTDGNSLKYTVYIDKVDGKQTPVATLTNIADTQASVAVSSGVYYWRVKSSDSNSSSFSQIISFTVN